MVEVMLHNAYIVVAGSHMLLEDSNEEVGYQMKVTDRTFEIVNYNNKILLIVMYIHF